MRYYSSTVALTIYKNDYRRMIAEAKTYRKSAFRFITKEANVYGDEYGNGKSPVTLYWSDVKWSDRYDEVGFVMDFIKNIPYSFKRVGESAEDIESTCNFKNDEDMILDGEAEIHTDIYMDRFTPADDWRDLFKESQEQYRIIAYDVNGNSICLGDTVQILDRDISYSGCDTGTAVGTTATKDNLDGWVYVYVRSDKDPTRVFRICSDYLQLCARAKPFNNTEGG